MWHAGGRQNETVLNSVSGVQQLQHIFGYEPAIRPHPFFFYGAADKSVMQEKIHAFFITLEDVAPQLMQIECLKGIPDYA